MPKVRTDIETLVSGGGRWEQKYPWLSKVMDGRVHEIEHGKDFSTSVESMRTGFQTYGRRNGVKLVVSVRGKNLLVQKQQGTPKVTKRKPAKRKPAKRR